MNLKDFIAEKGLPEHLIEQIDDKLIITDHNTCRIELFIEMLNRNMLAGKVELTIKDKHASNDFCTSIDNKIDPGDIEYIFSVNIYQPKQLTKDDVPPKEIYDLLELYSYSIHETFEDRLMYIITNDKSKCNKYCSEPLPVNLYRLL